MSASIHLTTEMIAVLGILVLTIFLFASNLVRVDVAAVAVLVLLGLTSLVPGYPGMVPLAQLFSGFSSNAVISIVGVMIIGAGLDRTGAMSRLAGNILRYGGNSERRIVTIVTAAVGVVSSLVQNIATAALFLPVVSRISRRSGIPASRLLMPMGFCTILGGTVTMVGNSSLILLNDLISTSNRALPANHPPMEHFTLLAVAPIGIMLLLAGIGYFAFFGQKFLPEIKHKPGESGRTLNYFRDVYGIEGEVYEARVRRDSPLVGKTMSDIESAGRAGWIIAMRNGDRISIAPSGETELAAGTEMAIMGRHKAVMEFAREYALDVKSQMKTFAELLNVTSAGISEVVIPPDSDVIGKSLRDIGLRRRYGATVLAVFRVDDVIDEDLPELVFQAGDTLVLHGRWHDLRPITQDNNFALVTDLPHDDTRPDRLNRALAIIAVTLGLILFTALPLPLALMTGAISMVLAGVLTMDEAYGAVSWQTVFLLASLIPLGAAVEDSGTAAWIAQEVLVYLGDLPQWVLQAALAVLATGFTLVTSNVSATVLMVPLAVNIAVRVGADPAVFALTVALATSNSFLIPTNQVNALIMGPGGYKVSDFVRGGGIMTILFLVVMMVMLNLVF